MRLGEFEKSAQSPRLRTGGRPQAPKGSRSTATGPSRLPFGALAARSHGRRRGFSLRQDLRRKFPMKTVGDLRRELSSVKLTWQINPNLKDTDPIPTFRPGGIPVAPKPEQILRSEEHTSELQSPCNLVCRLLL